MATLFVPDLLCEWPLYVVIYKCHALSCFDWRVLGRGGAASRRIEVTNTYRIKLYGFKLPGKGSLVLALTMKGPKYQLGNVLNGTTDL